MKFTQSTLKKIENLIKEAKYTIRYERGNFAPGYCLLEEKKVVVVNKYYSTEARISALIDMLTHLKIDLSDLSEESKTFYLSIQQLEFKNPK